MGVGRLPSKEGSGAEANPITIEIPLRVQLLSNSRDPSKPAQKPHFHLARKCLILRVRNSELSLPTTNTYWAKANHPVTLMRRLSGRSAEGHCLS